METAAPKPGHALRDVLIGAALFALAALSYGLSRLPLHAWELPIAFGIATAKATLILLFFMGLLRHSGGSKVAFAIALTFVLVLMTLVLTDVGLREHAAVPPGPFPVTASPLPATRTQTPLDRRPSERGREHPDQGTEGP